MQEDENQKLEARKTSPMTMAKSKTSTSNIEDIVTSAREQRNRAVRQLSSLGILTLLIGMAYAAFTVSQKVEDLRYENKRTRQQMLQNEHLIKLMGQTIDESKHQAQLSEYVGNKNMMTARQSAQLAARLSLLASKMDSIISRSGKEAADQSRVLAQIESQLKSLNGQISKLNSASSAKTANVIISNFADSSKSKLTSRSDQD